MLFFHSKWSRKDSGEALDYLCDWADSWGMAFNYSKCNVMHVGKKNPKYDYFMRYTKVSTTDAGRDFVRDFTRGGSRGGGNDATRGSKRGSYGGSGGRYGY